MEDPSPSSISPAMTDKENSDLFRLLDMMLAFIAGMIDPRRAARREHPRH